MYKIKVDNGANGIKEFNMIKKDEPCPICGKELGYFTWNMMHGEVTSGCCGCVLQIKSYFPGDDATDEYKEFVESIGKDDVGYIFQIDEKYIEPLKKAIKETGITDINSKKNYDLVQSYFNCV